MGKCSESRTTGFRETEREKKSIWPSGRLKSMLNENSYFSTIVEQYTDIVIAPVLESRREIKKIFFKLVMGSVREGWFTSSVWSTVYLYEEAGLLYSPLSPLFSFNRTLKNLLHIGYRMVLMSMRGMKV